MTVSVQRQRPVTQSDSPQFQRFIGALPPDVLQTLSATQLAAMAEALKPDKAAHWIDFRVSVPLPVMGFYVVLLAGKERRKRARLAAEGQVGLKSALMLGGILAGIALVSTLVAVLGLHLMRHTIGPGLLPVQMFVQPG